MRARLYLVFLIFAAVVNCGGDDGGNNNGDGGTGSGDGGGGSADAFGGSCTVGGSVECSDCVDNDSDGKIDGFDPECAGPADDREDSFGTGIPGDNIDATQQDCFFDGNSGAGDDGCNQHVCCLLQADDVTECMALAPQSLYNQYDKTKCYQPFGNTPVPAKCTMNCGPLTPPGCDCFGCCTVCNENGCADVVLNPAVSPNCDQTNITDCGMDGTCGTADDPCKRCVKSTCGTTECGGQTCILCPGQDPSTLPTECNGSTCPQGIMACDANGACPEGQYCSSGCCIGIIL